MNFVDAFLRGFTKVARATSEQLAEEQGQLRTERDAKKSSGVPREWRGTAEGWAKEKSERQAFRAQRRLGGIGKFSEESEAKKIFAGIKRQGRISSKTRKRIAGQLSLSPKAVVATLAKPEKK